jgi:predicted transcriptional regulator
MEPECRRISKAVIPAVRAYLATMMSEEYGYRQQRIAKKLGIAQVAVSKYLNGRYSKEVARIKQEISSELSKNTARHIIESGSADEANEQIERFSEQYILTNRV